MTWGRVPEAGAPAITISKRVTVPGPCQTCGGSGADPEDAGDWVPGVHMHDPGSRGPCPACHAGGHVCGA